MLDAMRGEEEQGMQVEEGRGGGGEGGAVQGGQGWDHGGVREALIDC